MSFETETPDLPMSLPALDSCFFSEAFSTDQWLKLVLPGYSGILQEYNYKKAKF